MGKAFKLQNGQILLSTEAPGGVYNSAQLRKIAELCDGDTALAKATEDQRLALFVAEDHVPRVASALRSTGLGVRHYQDGLHQPVNCIGELCPEAQQNAMMAGMEIAAELAATKLDSPLKIGINGCARGCVATHTLDISILGDSNGYRISLGGKNSQIPEMAAFMADGVPSAKLPKLIAKIVSIYKEIAEPGESLQEVIERHGAGKFIAALAPYSQDAHQEDSAGGLGEFGASEDLKLDDLGSDNQAKHDGPAIDLNLAAVELQAEPSVDGIRAEPVLHDEEEIIADHELIDEDENLSEELGGIADDEIEPIQPVHEEHIEELESSSEQLDHHDHLDTFNHEEDAGIGESLETSAQTEEPELGAEDMQAEELHDHVDAMRLEAAAASVDDDLNVEIEVPQVQKEADPQLAAQTIDAHHGMEEEIIGADDIGPEHFEDGHHSAEPTMAEATHVEIKDDHQDAELEPEHLVADEIALEAASPDAAVVARDQVQVTEAAPVYTELAEDKPNKSAEDGEFVAEVVTPTPSLVEDTATTESSPLAVSAVDSVPSPDESVLPQESAHLLAPDDALPDLEMVHEDEEFPDLSEDEIAAAEAVDVDSELEQDDGQEIDEASQDQLERNIQEEIAAEENIPEVEDSNSDDRAEAMQLIAAQAVVSKPQVLEETKMAPTHFPPRSTAEAPTSSVSKSAAFDFIGLDFNADGRISLQFASGAAMAIDPWALVGASRRELRLAGKLIVLTPTDGGINVEVDGVAIFLPQRSAA